MKTAPPPIGTALAAFGMSGKLFHAPFLAANPRFTLLGAWERSNKQIGIDYPGTVSYPSYEVLLADAKVDLVIVNTPNTTHFDLALRALEAGKHVTIEKPFTVLNSEARYLTELAKEKKLGLSVYHNRRWDPDFLTVKKVLEEGWIGTPVEAELHFDRFSKTLSPKAHKEMAVKGTGILYDLGSHLIDQALQLFGKPEKIFADIRIVRPISQVDDCFDLLMYYKNGFRARLKATYSALDAGAGFLLHGTEGSFVKPRSNVQEEALALKSLSLSSPNWGIERNDQFGTLYHLEKNGKVSRRWTSERGHYMTFFDSLADAIANGLPVPVSGEDAELVIRIIEAALESNLKGSVVSLDQ